MIWVIALVLAFSGHPGLAIYACLIAYILGD